MALLSQALHLGYLLSPHSAFQGHAAHTARWPAMLSPNGSSDTCLSDGVFHIPMPCFHGAIPVYPKVVITFLQAASRRSLHSDYYAPSDCLEGLGVFVGISPCLLSTLLHIPFRLSRVPYGGLKQDDVGGALSTVPSALCGSPDGAWGTSRFTPALFHWAYGVTQCRASCCRHDSFSWSGWHHRQGMPGS